MIRLLVRLFIRDHTRTQDAKVRGAYGTLAGALGIVCNFALFAVKLFIALTANSIAVAADAFNNLSDAASSIVTLAGFRMSERPPDEDHPFGHGRMEYIAGLAVAFLIVAVGLQFLRSSLERVRDPQPVFFSWLALTILIASLALKLWMYGYNRYIGRLIDSEAVRAAAFDSLSDVLVTSLTILSLALAPLTPFPLDGWFGFLVGGFVIYGGVKIIRDTVSPLLGTRPDAELVQKLRQRLLAVPEILGVHDIIINNYGPNRYIASAHAVADYRNDPFSLHNVLDRAEKSIGQELHMHLTLHYDPIDPSDPETRRLTGLAEDIVGKIDPFLQIHDFRIASRSEREIRVAFDVVVPRDYPLEHREIQRRIMAELHRADPRLRAHIEVESSYV